MRFAILTLALLSLPVTPQAALSEAPFYQGKTITVVQARQPGGTGDMWVRAVFPSLRKYIPGNPTIVTEYMPGAGGRKAGNYFFSAAKPDGLTIGAFGVGFVSNAIIGATGVSYDPDKVIYLGSGFSNISYVFHTTKGAGLDTLDKLRAAAAVRIGAQTVGSGIYITSRLFAWLLDLKEPRFVTGYSGPEIDVALARGEVDARVSHMQQIPHRNSEWLDKQLMHWNAVYEIPRGYRLRHPAFDPAPSIDQFVKTDRARKVLVSHRNLRLSGSPYILPPGTPRERVELLREAFRKAFDDPEYTKAVKELTGEEAFPITGEEQEKTVREIPRDRESIELFKRIAGSEPLPPP